MSNLRIAANARLDDDSNEEVFDTASCELRCRELSSVVKAQWASHKYLTSSAARSSTFRPLTSTPGVGVKMTFNYLNAAFYINGLLISRGYNGNDQLLDKCVVTCRLFAQSKETFQVCEPISTQTSGPIEMYNLVQRMSATSSSFRCSNASLNDDNVPHPEYLGYAYSESSG